MRFSVLLFLLIATSMYSALYIFPNTLTPHSRGLRMSNERIEVLTWKDCNYDLFESKNSCVDGMSLLLKHLSLALECAKMPYFMFGGGLLGMTRNKTLLPWDHDIDVVLNRSCHWLKHEYRTLRPCLHQEG